MHMTLHRRRSALGCTLGDLSINGNHECFTLEDVVRPDGEKVYGETAIPAGTYEVTITWSPRFKTRLPILADVPNFSGVRIHPGNKAEDTEGCILVGRSVFPDRLGQSRLAFDVLMAKIETAVSRGEHVTIEIVNAPD